MSATENYVAPAFIFPRKRIQGYLLNNAPEDSIGMASDSGFVNTGLFLEYLECQGKILRHEFFPGKTEAVDKNQYEISTTVLSASNSFRWPDKPDKIWYNINDLIEVISEPVLINKRGF